MTRFILSPLQKRLAMVATIALVPLAILSLAHAVISTRDQRDSVMRAATETISAVTTAIDAELEQSLASIETLGLSPLLQSSDLRGFHEEARQLLLRRPAWSAVVLLDAKGQQLMNASVPFGTPLGPTAESKLVAQIVRNGKPHISGVVVAPVAKRYIVAVGVPVTRRGQTYVLRAGVLPESLLEVLDRQRIISPGVLAIVDERGVIVARSRSHEEFVGKPAVDSLLDLIAGRKEGWGEATTKEGETLYTVFQRSPRTQWTIALGLPREWVEGFVIRRYLLLGSGILASLLLGLAAAFWISLAISRPARQLGHAARSMGHGERPGVPDTPLPEFRQVGEALVRAHEEREALLGREREARREAEQANRLKDEFLAMLGHELRNPLSAISNAAQILEHVGDTKGGIGQEALAILRRQSAHLGLLTDELLDVGRVMAGNIPMQMVAVNLAEAAKHAVEAFRATGRLDAHIVRVDTAPAWVRADPTRLEQITSNLLTNAVKYTPAGGHVVLKVDREGSDAVLSVTDDGVGLEPELLPRVFDLFVQGRRSLDRSQGGLGVGLTLVHRIAEILGGRVEAYSDGPWTGSRFVVRLPAIEAPAEQTQAPAQDGTLHRHRVVIVEDNADARLSLRGLLELQGHTIYEATDGPSGIETILREKPDVALIDIGLPGANGYEVARAVREKIDGSVRLVAITGYGLPEDRKKSAQAGFDLHLVKPVDDDALGKVFAPDRQALS